MDTQDKILAELVKLNANIDKLLCLQMLREKRANERHIYPPGPKHREPTSDDMERENQLYELQVLAASTG